MFKPVAPESPATEMSCEEGLVFASQLHRGGQLEPAERIYRALLQISPGDPNPMHYLGVLMHQRGQRDEALALMRKSLEIDDQVGGWHNNLGNVLLDMGRKADAVDAYQRCTELDPANVEVLNNLGVMQRSAGHYEDAEATFKRAIERKPDFADAHSNLADLYYIQNRVKEGYAASAQALALQPAHSGARRMLALVYARLGRLEDAAALYREWLEQDPGNEQALHYLAACGGAEVPERADDVYVERVFDSFAASFDAKLALLEYKAPQLVAGAVERLLGAPPGASPDASLGVLSGTTPDTTSGPGTLHIVDAGCGTGLCGAFLAPYARTLVGVDLSANMLALAAARGMYTELVKGELVAFLRELAEPQDLIVSADTLCYFGRLDEAFAATGGALRDGGATVFTVEAHEPQGVDGDGFRLNPHGRYSHTRAYVERELARAGFSNIVCESVALRMESGEAVGGWLVTATRAASEFANKDGAA